VKKALSNKGGENSQMITFKVFIQVMNQGNDFDISTFPEGITPLIRAVKYDSAIATKALLELGANPLFTVKMNQSPLTRAIDE
jgi:ankyrin repeat protein